MEEENKLLRIGAYEFNSTAKLGEGAYGTVFRGRCTTPTFEGKFFGTTSPADDPEMKVALKRVPSGMLKDCEVDFVLKTHHSPFVVGLYDLVNTEDATYVVMELLDTDLGNFLKSYGGSLSVENFETLAKCLAEGYSVLHKAGVVHRDIKPQNILLKLKPEIQIGEEINKLNQPKIEIAKIADFGCSRDSKDAMANMCGTFAYMAPEVGACIVESNLYNEEIDMWSIGVLLYECLEGDVPFSEQELCKLYLRAMNGNYFGYKSPMPKIGAEKYRQIIGKLLSLDPMVRLCPKEFRSLVFEEKENQNLNDKLSVTGESGGILEQKSATSASNIFKTNIKRTASALFSRMNLFHNIK